MENQPLTVYDWPAAANCIKPDRGVLVLAVRTPLTMPRAEARQKIREALLEVLAAQLACSPAEIELFSQAGQALQLLWPERNIGLSVSHEPGMSLAAINMNGPVGVDVMATNSTPATNEIYTLAADYLGCRIAEHLARLPSEQHSKSFSEAWTELEARLKCRGEPLAEWAPAKEQWLAACTSRTLQTPDGYVGTVAFLDSAASQVATTLPVD